MSAVSPKDCANRVLETVPPIMRFLRFEMRRGRFPGLSVPQFRALRFLERYPGRSLSDVANHVGLSLPAMSRLIEGLVGRGLALRGQAGGDRRRVVLRLTDPGVERVRAARKAAQERLARLLGKLSERERASVVEAMEALHPLFAAEIDDTMVPPG